MKFRCFFTKLNNCTGILLALIKDLVLQATLNIQSLTKRLRLNKSLITTEHERSEKLRHK